MKYWQLMSGDQSREFSSVCLDFGVAAVGPGTYGPVSSEAIADLYKASGDYNKIKPIFEFKVGDRIVLKKGQREIKAVGEVVECSGKVNHFFSFLEDVDGWDLNHAVKVRWKLINIPPYDRNRLTRSTLTALIDKELIEDIESKWNVTDFEEDKYSLPYTEKNADLTFDEIEQFLIDAGVRIADAENMTSTIQRVAKLAKWYLNNSSVYTSEHEIRAFLVIPFLESLGWSKQKISIERERVDITLYQDANREKPVIGIETKNLYEGSFNAINQIKEYSKKEFLSEVKLLLVTDGLRYWVLEKINNDFEECGYMNFAKLKHKNLAYPKCYGSLEVIKQLLP